MLNFVKQIIVAAEGIGSVCDISILDWDAKRNGKRIFIEGTTKEGQCFSIEAEMKDPEQKQEDTNEH